MNWNDLLLGTLAVGGGLVLAEIVKVVGVFVGGFVIGVIEGITQG